MKYAIIENDVVINIAISDAPLAPNWIQSDTAGIGDIYNNGVFAKPLPDINAMATSIRGERDRLLSESDWTQVLDAPVDRDAWATYRQALRDIPQQTEFPTSIDWPVQP